MDKPGAGLAGLPNRATHHQQKEKNRGLKMSIQEYAVPNDFFQCQEIKYSNELIFPCCVCRNKKNAHREDYPCKYCGHNHSRIESFQCLLCGERQDGNMNRDGKTIAAGTPAEIRGLCVTCFNIIKNGE
jgi:hypothetical protein